MILITGASGQVGLHVISALKNKGAAVRAFVHSQKGADAVLAAGADEVFVGDMHKDEDLRKAMRGIDTVYFVCPAADPEEDHIGETLIRIAKDLGNVYFVYHSVLHSLLTDMPHHAKKNHVEKMLVDSGLEYTIIQPAVFMQMFGPAIQSVAHGGPLAQKFFVSEETEICFIDLKDFAEAVAEIIVSRRYIDATIELCGPDNVNLNNVLSAFSEVAGREVANAFLSDAEFLERSQADPDSYAAKTLLTMFRHYNDHSFRGNSAAAAQILGHQPRSLRDFLHDKMPPSSE